MVSRTKKKRKKEEEEEEKKSVRGCFSSHGSGQGKEVIVVQRLRRSLGSGGWRVKKAACSWLTC